MGQSIVESLPTRRRLLGGIASGFVLALLSAGCGGSLSTNGSTSGSSTVTATAETNPASILVSWTGLTLSATQSFVGYNIYRDGSAIASVGASSTTFTDSTATAAHNLTLTTVASGSSSTTTSVTVAVAALTTGSAHNYTVTEVYQDSTTLGQTVYREVSLGTSSSVTLPTGATSVTATVPSKTAISVAWTLPTLAVGQSLVAYNVYRDGSAIASVAGSTATYLDATTTATHSLTYSTVISGTSTTLSSNTVSVVPVTVAVAHIYVVTVVYLDATTSTPTYYEVTLGTSASATIPSS